jgi:hypothetical protein
LLHFISPQIKLMPKGYCFSIDGLLSAICR